MKTRVNLTSWSLTERAIACHIIGGSATDESKRCIGYPLWENGWTGYVKDNVVPCIEAGFKRISLQNPAGSKRNECMQPDQFVEAIESGLNWIANDFVQAWKPITSSGIEVICYLGDLKDDIDFQTPTTNAGVNIWLDRALKSYQLPLQAGMSIAFDALFNVDDNSPAYNFYKLMQSLNVTTYVEPVPHKDNKILHDSNCIITEQLYQNRSPDWYPDESLLTGEKIRLLNTPFGKNATWENQDSWIASWLSNCLESNFSPMFGAWNLLSSGSNLVKYDSMI